MRLHVTGIGLERYHSVVLVMIDCVMIYYVMIHYVMIYQGDLLDSSCVYLTSDQHVTSGIWRRAVRSVQTSQAAGC